MKHIDLFRPFMADHVLDALRPILTYGEEGRMYIGEGAKVLEFEQTFQHWVGLPQKVLALNSGTSALELACSLIGLEEGDEVIAPPISCFASYAGILINNARIVWADVVPETGLIDIQDVLRKVTPRTKAIITVSWGGQRIDHRPLRHTKIPIIFDDAHGSYYPDPFVDYIVYSTQAIKFLTSVDGGFLAVPDQQYDKGRLLRWYGLDRLSSSGFRCGEQNIALPGRKLHMNDVTATIGLSNLHHVAGIIEKHRANARFYDESIQHANITKPSFYPTCTYWLYTLQTTERDRLKTYLADHGIESSLVHARNDTHAIFAYASSTLPGVDIFNATQLSIPVGWWITEQERSFIVNTLNAWV